jgi:magnesium-transporting ATPase (P-type)
MAGVLLIATALVFLVLAVQFNSFRDPLIILLGSIPLALFAALTITFLNFSTINIFSQGRSCHPRGAGYQKRDINCRLCQSGAHCRG